MNANVTSDHVSCLPVQSKRPGIWQRNEIGKKRPSFFAWILLTATVLFLAPLPVIGQDHGSGGGGGGGCGDVYGDLIHILRDELTGQPILAQRWIELPGELQGYGWGYCPIAVYGETKEEIPFLPYTCDIHPDDLDMVEEVNYFGRLNGGRTKERNHRMHLDEVISNMKAADTIMRDSTGRIMMGFDCKSVGHPQCAELIKVDSPMESMAMLTRDMKYGHLATDPYEINTWAHGDPKLPVQFHPALSEEDWPKFHTSVRNLLPFDGNVNQAACWDYNAAEEFQDLNDNGVWDPAEPFMDIDKDGEFDAVANGPGSPAEPFTDMDGDGFWDPAEPIEDEYGNPTDANENGVADKFVFTCADPEHLSNKDFISAAVYLAAAANKTGRITMDLVQYTGRVLKWTKNTEHTAKTLDTLPALYYDCWAGAEDPVDPPEVGEVGDPDYLTDCGDPIPADKDLTPNYLLFPDVQELFVDFSGLDEYEREDEKVDVILDKEGTSLWTTYENEPLLDWLLFVNGNLNPTDPDAEEPLLEETQNIRGFVNAGKDFLRGIEYFHNYSIPDDLYCTYDPDSCIY